MLQLYEAGDAKAQVEANKRIATLAFENAKLEQSKRSKNKTSKKPADVRVPEQPRLNSGKNQAILKLKTWAAKNSWFGQDRAMTYTAFEIHKDLVEKEGFDPNLMNIMQKLIKESVLTFRINLLKQM